jgi:AcrR family transcriptional regulator
VEHAEQILEAAGTLFYQRGVQAVGMDELRNASGVSLKRLYQCFPSKEALVVAYLDRRDDRWMDALTRYVESRQGRIPAVFDWLATWFAEDDFRGCGFLNAFGQLGLSSPAVADTARRHKDRLHAYLAGLARDAGASDPSLLAHQLLILIDGATVTAMLGRPGAAAAAKAAAAALLNP